MVITEKELITLLGECYYILQDVGYNFNGLRVDISEYEITPVDLQEIFEILAEETRKC